MQVNGIDLFVRRFGDSALPPQVVIHGGPTWDHSYLLPAVAELADIAHVVLFDLRGCGRSSRVPPVGDLPVEQLQPELIADDTAALIRTLGDGPADVLGFSFGGRIAMRLVEQHPQVVKRLVLASTTAYTEFEESPDHAERAAMCAEIDPQLYEPGAPDGALSRAMAYAGVPLSVWRLDLLAEWHRVLEQVRFSSDYNEPYAKGTLRPGGPARPVEALRSWGGPALILQGVREMTFPIETARRLHRELPGSTLAEVPDAAHMAHFDNPGFWVRAIREFLNR